MDKFIDIRKTYRVSVNEFNEELKYVNIYSKLNIQLDSSPQDNCTIVSHLLDCA